MEYATLQNGLKMPMEGFGFFKFVIKRNVSVLCWMRSGQDTA